MKLIIFAYDFPHLKTQDFLFRLLVEGYEIECVIAAPWQKLSIPSTSLAEFPSHTGMMHPRNICKHFSIPYFVLGHNSEECENLLKKFSVSFGIIAGARILRSNIINCFKGGIINIHPGMLPWIRGLDPIKWSIYKDRSIGNSAHIIDARIDVGKLVYREQLEILREDTLIEIGLRLQQKQADVLIESLRKIKDGGTLENLETKSTEYFRIMPKETIPAVLKRFSAWKEKYDKEER